MVPKLLQRQYSSATMSSITAMSINALDTPLDPNCPLCRGLRPRGWPQNWDREYVGERINLYWFLKDIAILPAQTCSFCCFIRDIVDHLCREGNHAWPDTLRIKGEPVKSRVESAPPSDDDEIHGLTVNSERNLLPPSDDSDEEIRGSIELFRSRPYSLTVGLHPPLPLRSREIKIYLQGDRDPLSTLTFQANHINQIPASSCRGYS